MVSPELKGARRTGVELDSDGGQAATPVLQALRAEGRIPLFDKTFNLSGFELVK